MELDDGELERVASSLGKTVDALNRKAARLTGDKRTEALAEADANEVLLRRVRDEQRNRRQ